MAEAFFYEGIGDGSFRSSSQTAGPWDATVQHGGPPAALLGRALEALVPGMRVRRVTVELLRPIPIATLAVRAEVLRGGRKAAWLAATLEHEGKLVARATGVAIRPAPLALPPHVRPVASLPPPGGGTPFVFPFFLSPVGYHTAVELVVAKGEWSKGPCGAWLRMKVPLVAGETPSPLQRVLVAADAGNGVSVTIPIDHYTFINPDLTVALHREPAGEWIGLDATTAPEPDGTGLQHSRLHDAQGPIGQSLQTLVIADRQSPPPT